MSEPAPPASTDPLELIRTRAYVTLLVFGAMIGVPVAVVAAGFMQLVNVSQEWLYETLPADVGLDPVPTWWPVPLAAPRTPASRSTPA